MNVAAVALLILVCGLFAYDWATLSRGGGSRARRMLWLQGIVFAGAAFFIVVPDAATRAAHAVGIGRGVDFVLYPVVIWLVRESLLNRRRRWDDAEKLTQAVRMLAVAQAIELARPTTPVVGEGH